MTILKFLHRVLVLLFIGSSMCILQACSNDDEPKPGNNGSDNQKTLTLFKRWYLTDFSGSNDMEWQSYNVVDHREYMEFSKTALYWNSRLGGKNSTYKLTGAVTGSVGSSFYGINVVDYEDSRMFTVKKMTEKHLLLYDQYEEMYRSFVSSSYAKFSDNGGDGNSNGNDDNDEDEDEDEDDGEWRDCYACNGSGVCYTCDGDGRGALIYGTDEYQDCKTCRGSGQCPKCDGSGQYWRD